MSTKRRRQSKSRRKKETRKLEEYRKRKLLADYEPSLNEIVTFLSSGVWRQSELVSSSLTEEDVLFLRRLLQVAQGHEGHIIMHPDTFKRLKGMEEIIKHSLVSHQSNLTAQSTSVKEAESQDLLSSSAATPDNILSRLTPTTPPQFGERLLLLILTKEERINIPGDLAEEFTEIVTKHGERYAKLWYYKQVVASAWPMIRKAVRLGLLAWVEEWIRRRI